MVEDGLEFYHDKTGLTVGKQPFLDAIKNNICGKVQRTIVPGSLEVYPLKDYGAVEIGVHRFHNPSVRRRASAKPNSSPSGTTRTAPGRSHEQSASTTKA